MIFIDFHATNNQFQSVVATVPPASKGGHVDKRWARRPRGAKGGHVRFREKGGHVGKGGHVKKVGTSLTCPPFLRKPMILQRECREGGGSRPFLT